MFPLFSGSFFKVLVYDTRKHIALAGRVVYAFSYTKRLGVVPTKKKRVARSEKKKKEKKRGRKRGANTSKQVWFPCCRDGKKNMRRIAASFLYFGGCLRRDDIVFSLPVFSVSRERGGKKRGDLTSRTEKKRGGEKMGKKKKSQQGETRWSSMAPTMGCRQAPKSHTPS